MFIKKVLAVLAASFIVFALPARAALVLPDLHDPGWATDRYEPASWANIGTFQGRNNVLQIGVDASTDASARPVGQQGSFYNTQGRQIAVTGAVGDSLKASLWLDPNWQSSTAGYVRTDLWGRAGGTEAETTYPLSGFTNFGVTTLRAWDADAGGWQNFNINLAPLWGTWVDLEILATATGYEYYVNDVLAYTDNTLGVAGGGLTRGFLQAYNFNDPALPIQNNPGYFARWANATDGGNPVPTPATLPLALLGLWFVGGRKTFRSLISTFRQRLRRFEQARREAALVALGGMSMRLA